MMKQLKSLLSIPFVAGAVLGAISTGAASGMLGSSIFVDVPAGSYYDEAVGELNSTGIIKGFDAKHFRPNEVVTRAQMAVILKRFMDQMNGVAPEESSPEPESSVSSRSRKSKASESAASEANVSSSSSTASTAQAASRNPKGTFRFTSNAFVVAESMGSATIAVVRTGGAEGMVSVDYATSDGSGINGTDYSTTKGTLTFENKQTSKTFGIPITNSVLAQGNKTVTITLSNITNGATLGVPATATLTITDNQGNTDAASSTAAVTSASSSSSSVNPAGTLSLAANAFMVNETSGTLTVTVRRDGGSTGAVGINYATIDGSALAGSQYTAANGTLSFAAGETTKSFTVSVINSASVTGNRTFGVSISNPTGGAGVAAGGNTANVILFDNESGGFGSGSFKLAKASSNISKGAGSVVISVTRVGGTVGTATVSYATNNGSATAGTDFTAVTGTLTFAPGEQAKSITVPILKTSSVNAGKTFTFDLSSPSSPTTLVVPYSETITIDN